MFSNTTGINNTANGYQALFSNTTGINNTANGYQALFSNTTGINNTANGYQALFSNTTGSSNTANGVNALFSNTTGTYNTANGVDAGRYISTGENNETSNNSVYEGYDTRALASGDTNEIVIGASARGNGSNSVTLGNTSITKTILQGNVGIGTTSPGAKLTVAAGTATTDVNAISHTQTWNGAVTFTADKGNVTVTSANNGSKLIDRQANGGSMFAITYYSANVTAAVGATATATNLIPAKCSLIGIATRVTTQLGASTGTTGYAVGDGTDPNRWGDITGVAVGTSSGQADATADPAGWFGAANNVVLTAAGGNFDGTGVIRVVASCRTMSAPTS